MPETSKWKCPDCGGEVVLLTLYKETYRMDEAGKATGDCLDAEHFGDSICCPDCGMEWEDLKDMTERGNQP